jgi:hypothetical protein
MASRAAFRLLSPSAYFSVLKMEMIFSSEKSVEFQQTTRRYIPEDNILHIRRNLTEGDIQLRINRHQDLL